MGTESPPQVPGSVRREMMVAPSRRESGAGGGTVPERDGAMLETYLSHRTLKCGEETSGGEGEP